MKCRHFLLPAAGTKLDKEEEEEEEVYPATQELPKLLLEEKEDGDSIVRNVIEETLDTADVSPSK